MFFSAMGVALAGLPEKSPRPLTTLLQPNCTNMTEADMGKVVSFYPHVKVVCAAENSTLIPTILNEEIEKTPSPGAGFQFTEIVFDTDLNHTSFQVALLPCSRSIGATQGTFEISTTMNLVFSQVLTFSRSLPFIITSASFAANSGLTAETTFSVACHFQNSHVRPVAEINTMVTRERYRYWHLAKRRALWNKSVSVEKLQWETRDRAVVSENTIMFSCISEKYVPDICSLSEEQIFGKLGKHLARDSNA